MGNSTRNINRNYEYLIILALVFGPFTQLRIGFVGVTEVLLLLLVLNMLFTKSNRFTIISNQFFIFTKFWVIFLVISMIGTSYNYIILNHVSGTVETLTFDLMSYIAVMAVCFGIELLLYNNKNMNIWSVLKKTYMISSTVLLILYIISFFTDNVFGISIKYHNFFNPFANNIHHVSMSIAPLPFLGLKIFSIETRKSRQLIILILIVSNIVTAIATGSLKVSLGLIAGLIVFIYILVYNKIKNHNDRWIFFLGITAVLIVFASLYFNQIIKYLADFFMEEDIRGGRQTLWYNSVKKIFESPFFGYGAGSHAQYWATSFSDAHQTFLTIGLQTGIIGIILYLRLHVKIIKSIHHDPYIVASYIGILMYALGGDIMRRLPMWIFLILFYNYSLNNKTILINDKISEEVS